MHDEAGERMRAQMDARKTVNAPVNADPFPVAPAESPTVPEVRFDAGFRAISGAGWKLPSS
jgi:hypothetical protein